MVKIKKYIWVKFNILISDTFHAHLWRFTSQQKGELVKCITRLLWQIQFLYLHQSHDGRDWDGINQAAVKESWDWKVCEGFVSALFSLTHNKLKFSGMEERCLLQPYDWEDSYKVQWKVQINTKYLFI